MLEIVGSSDNPPPTMTLFCRSSTVIVSERSCNNILRLGSFLEGLLRDGAAVGPPARAPGPGDGAGQRARLPPPAQRRPVAPRGA